MIYGIVKNRIVENIVEAESSTPFGLLFPHADEAILVTPDTGFPHIGLGAKNGKFQPFLSWSFDESINEWVAPVTKPVTGIWQWDESTLQWLPIEEPAELEE